MLCRKVLAMACVAVLVSITLQCASARNGITEGGMEVYNVNDQLAIKVELVNDGFILYDHFFSSGERLDLPIVDIAGQRALQIYQSRGRLLIPLSDEPPKNKYHPLPQYVKVDEYAEEDIPETVLIPLGNTLVNKNGHPIGRKTAMLSDPAYTSYLKYVYLVYDEETGMHFIPLDAARGNSNVGGWGIQHSETLTFKAVMERGLMVNVG